MNSSKRSAKTGHVRRVTRHAPPFMAKPGRGIAVLAAVNAAMTLFGASAASADQIGVNFMGADSATNSFISTTVAGLSSVQQSNWNLENYDTAITGVSSGSGSSASPMPLVDSNGNSTTAGYYLNTPYPIDASTAYGAGLYTPTSGNYTPDLALLEGIEERPNSSPSAISLTVVNVPLSYQQSGYSVYVYFDANATGNGTAGDVNEVTVGSTTYYWESEGPSFTPAFGASARGAAADSDFVLTDNIAGGAGTANADYALFSGMAESTFTITVGGNSSIGAGIAAFQIVQTPEPASIALIGMGAMGILMRRRRRGQDVGSRPAGRPIA